jgi:hypothetical protein
MQCNNYTATQYMETTVQYATQRNATTIQQHNTQYFSCSAQANQIIKRENILGLGKHMQTIVYGPCCRAVKYGISRGSKCNAISYRAY